MKTKTRMTLIRKEKEEEQKEDATLSKQIKIYEEKEDNCLYFETNLIKENIRQYINNDSNRLYTHGTNFLIYIVLMINNYIIDKNFFDRNLNIKYIRLVDRNMKVIYTQSKNQIDNRLLIDNVINKNQLCSLLEEKYSKSFQHSYRDNFPVIKDFLLSVSDDFSEIGGESALSFLNTNLNKMFLCSKRKLLCSNLISHLINYFDTNSNINPHSKDKLKQLIINKIDTLLSQIENIYNINCYHNGIVFVLQMDDLNWKYNSIAGGKEVTRSTGQSRIVIHNSSIESIEIKKIYGVILNSIEIKNIIYDTICDIGDLFLKTIDQN